MKFITIIVLALLLTACLVNVQGASQNWAVLVAGFVAYSLILSNLP